MFVHYTCSKVLNRRQTRKCVNLNWCHTQRPYSDPVWRKKRDVLFFMLSSKTTNCTQQADKTFYSRHYLVSDCHCLSHKTGIWCCWYCEDTGLSPYSNWLKTVRVCITGLVGACESCDVCRCQDLVHKSALCSLVLFSLQCLADLKCALNYWSILQLISCPSWESFRQTLELSSTLRTA